MRTRYSRSASPTRERTALDTFPDLGALRKKHEEGESVISGADVQQLTDILSGKGIPSDGDAE